MSTWQDRVAVAPIPHLDDHTNPHHADRGDDQRDRHDVGLFGPRSVTWRLHAEPVMGLAGLRALLLQALHPMAAAGVHQNSAFRTDPWGRLARTADYVGTVTFGSTAAAMVYGARVRSIHAALRAVDPRTGRHFALDDPEPLAWVHNCLIESVISVLERSGVRMDRVDVDRYVAEQVRAASLVGLEPDQVPHDRAGLDRYFRQMRSRLAITDMAREEASIVIAPPIPTRYAPLGRPAWSAVAGLAFAALPAWARRLYAIPQLPGAAALHGSGVTVALHAVRASMQGVQAVVPALSQSPHLRSARERLAAAHLDHSRD
ncbi:MAG: oxygenase MpaB family protein [Angustibacter sp.]